MKTQKKVLLEELINNFLEDEKVADGIDGCMSDTLHKEMADAAEAVYDSAMNTQSFMKRENYKL